MARARGRWAVGKMLRPAEMAGLWELEGPSGLAHSHSAALTFLWEGSESETSVTDTTLGPPSEVASDSMTDGPGPIARGPLAYNVCLPYELDLACFQPATPTEATLKKSLHQGHISVSDLEAVLVALPSKTRAHHLADTMGSTLPPLAFTAGAFGFRPWTYDRPPQQHNQVRACSLGGGFDCSQLAPCHKFSSFTVLQNVASRLHRDRHNRPGSANLLFPLTLFEGGELWLQSAEGRSQMSGFKGDVLPLFQDEVPLCQFFDPRKLHCTLPWSGDRTVVAAYTIRGAERLSVRDSAVLSRMGFFV